MDNRPPDFRFLEDKDEIARLRAEVDKSNKGLERAGEIETTLRAALREAEGDAATLRGYIKTFGETPSMTASKVVALQLRLVKAEEREAKRMALAIQGEEKAELIRRLAQAEADKARMEGALEASTFLRDAVQSWRGLVMESLPKEARHAFRMNVTERLVLYDRAVRALSGPAALEAVRRAVAEWDVYVNDFQNLLPHEELIEAMKHLRAAFGLEPKP